MNRDILSSSNVANRDVFFFVRNGPNPDVQQNSQMNIVPLLVIAPAMPPRHCPPRTTCEPCLALAGFPGGSSCRQSWERGSHRRHGKISM